MESTLEASLGVVAKAARPLGRESEGGGTREGWGRSMRRIWAGAPGALGGLLGALLGALGAFLGTPGALVSRRGRSASVFGHF